MPYMEDKIARNSISSTIAKGALVNTLGIVGKIASPLLFIVITRLYGPDIMGSFYLAFTMMSMMTALTVSGFRSGVLMFASRFHESKDADEKDLYGIFANAVVISLSVAFLLVVLVFFAGEPLLKDRYPQPVLWESLRLMVWALPLNVIPPLVIAATRSLMIMKWDAVIDAFLVPFSLLVYAVVFFFITPGIRGLMISYLLSGVTVAAVSLIVFCRYFSFFKLLRAVFKARLLKKFIWFSLPESLNMTFNQFITNLDVVMLGYFSFKPEVIGFYAMGAQIVRNLRQVKLAFSGIYAPIIARLHKRGDLEGISHSFSMVSRWTSMLGFPAAMLIFLFKDELLLIFHSSFTGDSSFMAILLIPPLLSCIVGLSGNILVMTGRSFWNLTNSLSVAGINAVLNYFLIPEYGLTGAATATACAAVIVSSMCMVEVYFLVGARLVLKRIYKPYAAALPSLVGIVVFCLQDAALLLPWKISAAVGAVSLFFFSLRLLGFEQEDKDTFFPKRARS